MSGSAFLKDSWVKDYKFTGSQKNKRVNKLSNIENFFLYLLEGIALTFALLSLVRTICHRGQSQHMFIRTVHKKKHSFDRYINLEYMYIGIYDFFFVLP